MALDKDRDFATIFTLTRLTPMMSRNNLLRPELAEAGGVTGQKAKEERPDYD